MMVEHEVLVIGAGHNELAVAAYLAKAGVDVGVLERRDFVGGGTQTREVSLPGFKQETDSVVHIMIQSNPMLLNDELGLKSKYGLEYIYPDVQYGNVFPDGSSFCIYPEVEKTCESIGKISPRDADNYMRFFEYSRTVLDFITP
ncbi:MAG TPA: NAD(P)-binding protein, partial [Bellilinea sp.]|nr:NAD(P)-binding protein [Bellilinea sp.]